MFTATNKLVALIQWSVVIKVFYKVYFFRQVQCGKIIFLCYINARRPSICHNKRPQRGLSKYDFFPFDEPNINYLKNHQSCSWQDKLKMQLQTKVNQ